MYMYLNINLYSEICTYSKIYIQQYHQVITDTIYKKQTIQTAMVNLFANLP